MVTVSVIATVLDEEASVGRLIDSLLAQTRSPDEVVVVDGGSRDRTVEVLKAYVARGAPLRVLLAPGANISQGRNAAIRAAVGEVIASTDAGVRLADRWLEELARPFEEEGGERVDVVSGLFQSDPRSVFELALGATTLPAADEIDASRFLPSSRSVAFRKSAWERAGGYPEGLDYCEDVVFDLALKRLGLRCAFAPAALAYFQPRPTPRAFFRQYYLYARGDGKAGLWPKRHLVRYLTYTVGPLAFLAGFWYKLTWLALALAGVAYVYRPYRHLLPALRGRGRADQIAAILWVPAVRLIGDVAKMVGYPVGVAWRLRHGAPLQSRPVDARQA